MSGQQRGDRISNLQDEILTHILSFLGIKEAVRTSVLSTRWISLWTFLPTLSLTDDCSNHGRKKKLLCKFVDSSLVDSKMPFLHNVSMIYFANDDGSLTRSWISAAIRRKISTLLLVDFSLDLFSLELPPTLLSGCMLVDLTLIMNAVIDFPVASPTYFPKLKLLYLKFIKFELGNDSASNLISSCPVLEDLHISSVYKKTFRTLNVSASCLKRLTLLAHCDAFLEQVEYDYALKILINAPALEHICIHDSVPYVYEVKDCLSLVQVDIRMAKMTLTFSDDHTFSRVHGLLKGISQLKSLSIIGWTIPDLFIDDTWRLPMFHNLKSLKLNGGICENWYLELVIALLKSCPVLETLIIKEFAFCNDGVQRDWKNDVPSCLISHLKTIEITRILYKYQVEEILYFLNNGNVLEKMILKGFAEECGEILTLPRASPTCQIEFQE